MVFGGRQATLFNNMKLIKVLLILWLPSVYAQALRPRGSSTSDVNGPSSSTNNNLVRFSGTGGKTLKDSSVIVDDSGNITTPGTATFGASGVGSADFGSTGVRVSGDTVGGVTFQSLGAGFAEAFKFDLDSTANTVKVTSTTGVATFDFGSIGWKGGSLTASKAIITPTTTVSASAIDLSTGTLFTKSLSADTTFTFSNPTEGQGFTVVVTNSSTYTVTWPTVEWKGGSTPAQSTSQTDIYSFLYANGKYLGAQSPGSPPGVEQEAYSAGTVYSLTATAALLDFGTTDPAITVTVAGTYIIYWGGNYKYNAATFAANQTANMKVRRTNNTAADISNATLTTTTRIITTITDDLAVIAGKPVKYTAAAGDILQVWGSLSATPAAGSVDCTDAWIVILRIQ